MAIISVYCYPYIFGFCFLMVSVNQKETEEKIKNAYLFSKDQTWKKVTNTYLKLWGVEK